MRCIGGGNMHEGALVLVGFMWSLSVLTQLFSLFSLWSDWLSSLAIFSENDEDTLQSLPLKLSCTCRKRIKWKKKTKQKETKQKETKQKETKLDTRKVKRENKINIIIYTGIYLPGNGAKNLTRPKD